MIERPITAFALVLGALACASPSPPPEDELPRAGPGVLYAIGASLGRAVAMYELDEGEAREVARGLVDVVLHEPYAAPLTPETQGLVTAFDEQRRQVLARREEQAGAPLLEAAAREPGAVKTESGMVLRVIEPGAGPSPTIFDFVRINYHGTLRDGQVFQSNRGQEPELVQLGTTTRCWQEALGAVAAGARVHAVCPSSLGYGWRGIPGGNVPGGGVLIFELELLAVEECSTHSKICSFPAK